MGPTMTVDLLHGNCLDILPTLPDCTVDSIVTDPPYELGFMGKKWDNSGIAYNPDLWAECLRVLKPGGHLLAFGGTRTYHRMAVAIEDAGFEIRDSLHWIYGSGFPKSLDVSKAIDKTNGRKFEDRYALGRLIKECRIKSGFSQSQVNEWFGYKDGCQHWERQDLSGARVPTAADYAVLKDRLSLGDEFDELVARIEAEREVIGSKMTGIANKDEGPRHTIGASKAIEVDITAPATEQAKEWQGWGTALKPAHEPIVVARKPLVGTVAGNVLQWGTGAINIDGTRVAGPMDGVWGTSNATVNQERKFNSSNNPEYRSEAHSAGRWPANIVFTHNHNCADICTEGCPVGELDRQSGTSKSQSGTFTITRSAGTWDRKDKGMFDAGRSSTFDGYGDAGGASRFFTVTEWDAPFRYVAKPGKRERTADGTVDGIHPTVKPLALMRWLVRLVTPPNGTVLEPFAGSGTTLVACHLEGFNAIGIEMTDEYLPIIEGRLEWARQQPPDQQSDQQELEL
jgi:DNA modification methylase